jgi:hypothetical protein
MRVATWPLLALCTAAACTLDLVDVTDPQAGVTRLAVVLRTSGEPPGLLVVSASLRPGALAAGRQREVPYPILGVLDRSLAPDTATDAGGVTLTWQDSVASATATVGPGTLTLPDVVGLVTPTPPEIVLRREAGHMNDYAGWQPGTDLVLLLEAGSGSETEAERALWTMQAVEWADGRENSLFSAEFQTRIADTVVIPGSWLGTQARDSLEIGIEYHRRYSGGSPGEYELYAEARQRLGWRVAIIQP